MIYRWVVRPGSKSSVSTRYTTNDWWRKDVLSVNSARLWGLTAELGCDATPSRMQALVLGLVFHLYIYGSSVNET